MPNLRTIWHFMPQNRLHERMLKQTIANFLQQCYSAILKLELYCSSILKKKIYSTIFPPEISPSTISVLQFSSLSSFSISSSALSSLQTQTPYSSQHQHQHHTPSSIAKAQSIHPHPHPSPLLKIHTASLSSLIVAQPI